jgi:hypothetical protein
MHLSQKLKQTFVTKALTCPGLSRIGKYSSFFGQWTNGAFFKQRINEAQ